MLFVPFSALTPNLPMWPSVQCIRRRVQWSMMHLDAGVQNLVRVRLISTKELFQISQMHGDNPWQEKRGLDGVFYNLLSLLTP